MPQEHINLGTPPSGVDGDTDRQAWVKAEDNFNELYGILGTGDGSIIAQVGENTADIAALQANDATQDGEITAIQTKDTAQDGLIAANGTDIATLKTQVAAINPAGGFKNKLINGNFDFWQRGTPMFLAIDGSTYGPDRWFIAATRDGGSFVAGAGWTRNAFALGQTLVPGNPKYFPGASGTITGGGGNAYWAVGQKIEGVQNFSGGKATVSFYVDCNVVRTAVVQGVQDFGTGGSPSPGVRFGTQTINIGAGFKKITLTFDVPSISGKTLGTSGNDNLAFYIWMQANATVGASTGVGTIVDPGSTLWLSEAQIEAGSNATPFELRPLAAELALCQRYYEKSYPIGVPPGSAVARGQPNFTTWLPAATANASIAARFKVTKRSTPAFSTYDDAGNTTRVSFLNGGSWYDNGNISVIYVGVDGAVIVVNNLTSGIAQLECNWAADAEL